MRRLQILQRALPADGDALWRHFFEARDPSIPDDAPASGSYRSLLDDARQVTQDREILLALQIDERRAWSRAAHDAQVQQLDRDEQAQAILLRELRGFVTRFQPMDAEVAGVLTSEQYVTAIRNAYDPYRRRRLAAESADVVPRTLDVGPTASERRWRSYVAEGACHRTYWIAQWPRLPVGPLFLTPLLLGAHAVHSIAVVFEPVGPERARRGAEAAITSDEADEELRSRRGFRTSAVQRRKQEATIRREEELASGHEEVRFAGYVTVSASYEAQLEDACGQVEHAARAGPSRPASALGRAGRRIRPRRPSRRARARIDPRLRCAVRPRLAERHGHRATTANAQAIYPFFAENGLGEGGVFIGTDVHGSSFTYDPFVLYERRLVSNPNLFVAGEVGAGKSSLVKSYLYRQALFGRVPWIADPKGEYAVLAHALGVAPIKLVPGGDIRLNPVARDAGPDGQLSLLRALAAGSLGRRLNPEEEGAVREALRAVNADQDEPTLPAIVELLFEPVDDMAKQLHTTTRALAERSREVALGVQRLCEGDLRGMFDGPTTPGLRLDGRAVVLDLSAFYDSAALGLVMTCASAWERGMIARLHAEADAEARRPAEDDQRLRRSLAGARRARRRRVAAGVVQALPPRRRPERRRDASPLGSVGRGRSW